jgi:tripartite-type tricarboxylate transporter receptor subunit TctC
VKQNKHLEEIMTGRRLAAAAVLALLTLPMLDSGIAQSQSYPTKSVRLILPFGSGGSVDVLSRMLGEQLSKRWGQTVVYDNRPGAGGNLAADLAAKSSPDGHTLFVIAAAFTVNATLYKNLPFDPRKDFAPVAMIGATQNVLSVNVNVPAKTVADLTALAKAKPGEINYSSTGVGTSGHMTMELYKSLAGVNLTHVPYKNFGQATTELMGGFVKVAMPSIPGSLGHLRAGRLRPLAVTGAKRSSALPDIPTMAEAGVKGYEATTWYAVLAPAGTPKEVIAKINGDIAEVLKDPALHAQIAKRGIEPETMTPDELGNFMNAEIEKWAKVIKAASIKMD